MSEQKITTSWMWAVDGGINALRIDTDRGLLQWYDSIGCTCDISTLDQTLAEFVDKGVPGMMAVPETEVLAEIQEAVTSLSE